MDWQTEAFFSYSCLKKERIKDLLSFFFLALLVTFKFWDYLNPNGAFFWAGDFNEVLPMRDYFYHNLRKGFLILWDPNIGAGMPYLSADYGVFYPIDLLMGVLSQNYFVPYRLAWIHAFHYWLGGIFTYLYTRQLQFSRIPALGSSICFMLGGFMMGHAYHRNVIQTYIWFPLILYFLDKALLQRKMFSAVLAGVFLAISFLAGHGQIFYYFFLFFAFYFLFRVYLGIREKSLTKMIGDTFYFMAMAFFCLGISSIQLLPLLSTSLSTYHRTLPFEWKAQIPFQLFNLIHFLIPNYTRWVASDIGEQYGYIGLLPFIFALWGLFQSKEPRFKFFWLVILFSFTASLGKLTPLFNFLYNFLPGFNQFRIPARFNSLIIFPLAVLSGFGLDHFLKTAGTEKAKKEAKAIIVMLFLSLGAGINILLVLLFLKGPRGVTLASWGQLSQDFLWFLTISGVSLFIVSLYGTNRKLYQEQVSLFFILLISCDLLFLGQIEGGGITTNPASFSRQAQKIIQEIKKEPDLFRIGNGEKKIPPNLLYRQDIPDFDVDNLVGYVGMVVPKEYLKIYSLFPKNPLLLDLLNVKYYIGSRPKMDNGFSELTIGGGNEKKEFYLNWPMRINSLSLYSALSNSTSIPQGRTVALIHFDKKDGSSLKIPIRAGIETSEWAIDRPGLNCAHQKAPVIESREIPHEGYQGHTYIFKLNLSNPIEVSRIGFEYLDDRGALIINKMAVNDLDINKMLERMIEDRFQFIAPNVYQNKFFLPRVFMIGKARAIVDEKDLLKNLEQLDPRDTVLLNHLPPGYHEPVNPSFSTQEAEITHYSPGRVKITTKAQDDKFLILSDTYSPYWKATIDQKSNPVLKVNYGLRGLHVPKGNHVVDFSFYFHPFYYGLAITVITLLAVLVLSISAIVENHHKKIN